MQGQAYICAQEPRYENMCDAIASTIAATGWNSISHVHRTHNYILATPPPGLQNQLYFTGQATKEITCQRELLLRANQLLVVPRLFIVWNDSWYDMGQTPSGAEAPKTSPVEKCW